MPNLSLPSLERYNFHSAKKTFTTRRVPTYAMSNLLKGALQPCPGDLVLARVDAIQDLKKVHLSSGREASLFVGDEIILCYGSRQLPNSLEVDFPTDLSACQLIAAGGLAGVMPQNTQFNAPTQITPLGLIADPLGRRVNIEKWALPAPAQPLSSHCPKVLAVVGSAMNTGKTTVAAHLIAGLVAAGHRVHAGKVTGSSDGMDLWLMADAGASQVLDFCDVGFATTHRLTSVQLEQTYHRLLAYLAIDAPDFIVLEIADSLYQRETSQLLKADYFRRSVQGLLFAAKSALDACAGVSWLQQQGLSPWAVSGLVSASPTSRAESAIATGLPVLTLEDLRAQALGLDSPPATHLAPMGNREPALQSVSYPVAS